MTICSQSHEICTCVFCLLNILWWNFFRVASLAPDCPTVSSICLFCFVKVMQQLMINILLALKQSRASKATLNISHDDVIKWKHFPRYCPFVQGIHRSPVNSPHKGQCRGALMFSLICTWINDWVNNREAGDLRHHRAHYGVIVLVKLTKITPHQNSARREPGEYMGYTVVPVYKLRLEHGEVNTCIVLHGMWSLIHAYLHWI